MSHEGRNTMSPARRAEARTSREGYESPAFAPRRRRPGSSPPRTCEPAKAGAAAGRLPVALALAALVSLGAALPAGAADARDCPGELERLTAENERLRQRVGELEARVDALQGESDDLRVAAGIAGPAVTAEVEAAEAARLTTAVEAGTRTVTSGASPLEVHDGTRAPHWIVFRYVRTGEAPVPEIAMDLRTQFSGGIYRDAETLVLSVDGSPVECPVTSYRSRPVTGGGSRKRIRKDHEQLTVAIPRAALERMAAARTITGTLGPTAFALTDRQLASLRVIERSLAE
jgi:hypothetical protein